MKNNVMSDSPSYSGQDQRNINFEIANTEHVEDYGQIKFSDYG